MLLPLLEVVAAADFETDVTSRRTGPADLERRSSMPAAVGIKLVPNAGAIRLSPSGAGRALQREGPTVFVVTINPHTTVGRYYGPQLVADGDWFELTESYLVIFAAHGLGDAQGHRRSVLIIPAEDLLAIDTV
jgi:hypothetical protein